MKNKEESIRRNRKNNERNDEDRQVSESNEEGEEKWKFMYNILRFGYDFEGCDKM